MRAVVSEGAGRPRLGIVLAAVLLAAASLVWSPAAAAGAPGVDAEDLRPIVFVHGQSGSAQQFQTQAQRFTSNGWPQDLLFAYEYDTSVGDNPTPAEVDAYVEQVLAETGADDIVLVGHSRGTTVATAYLDETADVRDKVAFYVNVDGRSPDELPGGVPTLGVWGEWNTAGSGNYRRGDLPSAQIGPDPDDNVYFPDKAHTEVMTSAGAFAAMYEFITGQEPATTDVRPEPAGRVTVAGRALLFPVNVGLPTTLDVYRVERGTGQRIGGPIATIDLGPSGDFGPLEVNGRHAHEFAVTRPDGSVHHFYTESFPRDDHFLRLLTSLPGTGLEAFTTSSPATTNLVISRQKEFWGDQGRDDDSLTVDGLELLTPAIAPRQGVNLAVFAFDVGLDGLTDVEAGPPFPFPFVSFITAADVAIEADADASGTVKVRENSRTGGTTTIAVPNWPSDEHRITVLFADGA